MLCFCHPAGTPIKRPLRLIKNQQFWPGVFSMPAFNREIRYVQFESTVKPLLTGHRLLSSQLLKFRHYFQLNTLVYIIEKG